MARRRTAHGTLAGRLLFAKQRFRSFFKKLCMFFAVTGNIFQRHIKRGNPVDQFPDAGRSKGTVLIDLKNVQKCLWYYSSCTVT